MAGKFTVELADRVVRLLGLDDRVEDSEHPGDNDPGRSGMHFYFLEDGTVLELGPQGEAELQQLVEHNGDLEPENTERVDYFLQDSGWVQYTVDGKVVGRIHIPI